MDNKGNKVRRASRAETVPNASSLNHSAPRSSADDATSQKLKRTVEVDFAELEDGTLLEMIENPQDATKSLLAIWNNGQVRYAEKLEHCHQVLVPIPRDAGMIRHVRLATGSQPYESAEALLKEHHMLPSLHS